jgi:hypothetical protein
VTTTAGMQAWAQQADIFNSLLEPQAAGLVALRV